MPDFSVVIPLYNKGPHIERALNSVMRQSRRPREVVVVDDGSNDGGFEWVKKLGWAELVLEQRDVPGPGGYAARNRGIALASGEWIAFLDADDEWQPNHLAGVAEAIGSVEAPGRVVTVFSGYEDIYGDGRRSTDPYTSQLGSGIAELSFEALIRYWVALNASPIWTSATVCRRSALEAAGAFPEARCRRGGDKDTWLRVAHLGTAVYTGQVTANYYRDAVNMTTKRGYSNTVPCIVETIKALAQQEAEPVAGLLRQMQNQEIFNYALVSARTGGLQRQAWADFDASSDALRAAALSFLSTPLGATAARGAHALRTALRR